MAAKWNWVIVFSDGTKLNVSRARGARDAAVKARLNHSKFDSYISEIQKHPGSGRGLVYKRYRFRGTDYSLLDATVRAEMARRGLIQPSIPPVKSPAPQTVPPTGMTIGQLENTVESLRLAYARERDQRDLLMKQHADLEGKYATALARIKELEAELKKPRTFKRIF